MAWNPTATRAFATFLSHTSGSGESSTDSSPSVHKSGPNLHSSREDLWTARLRRGGLGFDANCT